MCCTGIVSLSVSLLAAAAATKSLTINRRLLQSQCHYNHRIDGGYDGDGDRDNADDNDHDGNDEDEDEGEDGDTYNSNY